MDTGLIIFLAVMIFAFALPFTGKIYRSVSKSIERIGGNRKAKRSLAREYEFVASTKREVYHTPDCKWAKKIGTGELIGFKTERNARMSGRRACGECNP